MGNVSIGTQMMSPLAYIIINGHYSKTVKVKLPKFELKPSLVVISITYIHIIKFSRDKLKLIEQK